MLRKAISSVFILVFIWGLFNEVVEGIDIYNKGIAVSDDEVVASSGTKPSLVKREQRKPLMVTEYGEISGVNIRSGRKGDYHLEFMTLEPNALFLPVLLHADMVFYVNTGSGKLTWVDDGKERKRVEIRRGDVYRLPSGSVFFIQSNLETERQKLRIFSIFSNTEENIYEHFVGTYSSISDLVLGFDRTLLESAFKVSEDVIEEMKSATRPPAIIHAMPEEKKSIFREIEDSILRVVGGDGDGFFYDINGGKKKKSKSKVFNILDADRDFENCNGWSVTVGRHGMKSLKDSNIGVFMVNLTKGSMMGPHWNPTATEIAVVLQGQGMVRVVCSSKIANETDCKNMRFKVQEGDVFAVPRFHPMAQMSFNNDSFVFMGFSTCSRKNYPQFLAGKRSVLQTLNRDIMALSFNVTNSTILELLSTQEEAVILDCTSCAEGEEIKMVKEREEEEARKKEEEERKREEEEEERRKKEEEEERKREEEEEEEARKREEEERKREEEEAEERKREEEERRKKEEEEERKREEEMGREQEEARKREEERQKKEREEEEKREEEGRRREEDEEEEEEERERERERREREAEERQEEERRRQEEEARRRGGGGEHGGMVNKAPRKIRDWKH